MLKFLTFFLALNFFAGIIAEKIPNQNPNTDTLVNSQSPTSESIPVQKLPQAEDVFLNQRALPSYPARNWDYPEPKIASKTALVYDASHDQILYEKNGIFEPLPIASLTKIMTALVVIENSSLDAVFKISREAVDTPGEMGYLRIGEELKVKDLLYALLVQSSNDAAIALAQNIPWRQDDISETKDSTAAFVKMMNQKASALKLKNTFFKDSSGLSSENYSCAWDVAKMLQIALADQTLREIMQTKTFEISSLDGKIKHRLSNTNKLLGVIPEIIGGKTGYTETAGNCMALAAKTPKNEEMLIFVVMDARDRLAETKTLFEWTKKAFLW